MMIDDLELVREYARCQSEEAFATLVNRHVNLVYSVAFRQIRDVHLAEEITQTVFVILARKAATLGPKAVVSGWLCRTAQFTASRAWTMRHRRQQREQTAYMQSLSNEGDSDAWLEIEPLLDAAMAQLAEKDYNAVVLRFFEDRSFQEVGVALGVTESGAKMRVNRALEKLRVFFTKRGLTFSAALIAASLTGHSVQAAPSGLAAATIAAAKAPALTASTSTLIKTTLEIMATKLKTAIVVGIIAIVAAGTATVAIHRMKSETRPPSFRFSGYGTPEAAVESMLWSASTGEPLEKLADGITPDQMDLFRGKMAGKSDAEIRQGCMAWASSMAGYKITQKEIVSEDKVFLHIHATPSADGLHTGHTVLVMKKLGATWKFAGNAQ